MREAANKDINNVGKKGSDDDSDDSDLDYDSEDEYDSEDGKSDCD